MSKEFSEETLNLLKGITIENLEKYSKVNAKSVLGKLIGTDPNLKTKIPLLIKEIESTIETFSKLSKPEFEEAHTKYTAHIKHVNKVEKRKGLPELTPTTKEYCFRFAPSPSGPLHVGHLIPLLLNSEYAKKYNGKLVLRLEDTNPSKISKEIYKQLEEDANWATENKISEVITQSEHIDDYYKYAKQLIKDGHAYISTDKPEEWRELVKNKTESPERNLSAKEQLKKWEEMHTILKEGSAVVRIKTDMQHKNPAIRDWPPFRITEESHPLVGKKHRVWPLMNFSVAVDDRRSNLTHVIRGKDHLTNADRQKYIYNYFNWDIPEYLHIGRVNFEGITVSASQFQKDIEEGKYSGRDDPKLPTAAAFRRRGISPRAFVKYVHELGPSKVDKTVSFEDFMKAIYAFNREIIEPEANRYFIIEDPVEVELNELPSNIKAELPLHPNFQSRGVRKFHKSNKFYIEKRDVKEEGNIRLMHLCNYSVKDSKFISENLDKELKAKVIHWLPISDKEKNVEVLVKRAHGKDIKAIGEPALSKLEPGTIIQFERKFFARFDSKEGNVLVFYETHK